MHIHVDSETGRLTRVLMARMNDFVLHEPMNEVQQRYYAVDAPRPDRLKAQHQAFAAALAAAGVDIVWAEQRTDTLHQVFVRDIAVVILDTLVVCALRQPLRRNEPRALDGLLERLDAPVARVTEGFVEAGDVMVHGGCLYVGQSPRTDARALDWLRRRFGDRLAVTPLALAPPFIHLDVVFCPVGRDQAIVHAPAFAPEALALLRGRFRCLEVDRREQFGLATNVLSLSPEVVVSPAHQARVNGALRAMGLHVVEVAYDEVAKLGGALRCATCPLCREPVPAAAGQGTIP
ncbi:MAG: dimethylarginine dimethylaminohydrolase family protein [Solidesulfovibrio sp. DCME]|uniref:dimethylarginine dimethylaminohydrolase family protein n=1 Tax=Solidesulfovibrio sp. DCME TaxID=3447380 RepID=UPI003D11A317